VLRLPRGVKLPCPTLRGVTPQVAKEAAVDQEFWAVELGAYGSSLSLTV
jgi:hypothetical protein